MDSVTAGLLICGCLFVILIQYARRETAKARLIMVGLAVAMLLILGLTPYKTLVDREFPTLSLGQLPPLQISLLSPDKAFSEAGAPQENDEVQIRMPLRVSGIAPGSVLIMSGFLIEIESNNGLRWNSGWKSPGLFLFPEQDQSQIDFALKKKLLESLKSSSPVKVRVSLALSVFLDQHAREFVTPDGSFCYLKWVAALQRERIFQTHSLPRSVAWAVVHVDEGGYVQRYLSTGKRRATASSR